MKLALDHHYSPRIAEKLREAGFDVVAAIHVGWHMTDDEALLSACADERRALLTNNVADFVAIVRRWHVEGRSHAGLVFTSDASMPRTRDTIGRYVDALARLMSAHPDPDGLVDEVHWL